MAFMSKKQRYVIIKVYFILNVLILQVTNMKNKILILIGILFLASFVGASYAQPVCAVPVLKVSTVDSAISNISNATNETLSNVSQMANDTQQTVNDTLGPIQTILNTINNIMNTITNIFQSIQQITGQ